MASWLGAVLLLACLLGGLGCAAHQARWDNYVSQHPGLSPRTQQDIRAGLIRVGMTQEQVFASWGKPEQIKRDVRRKYVKERWRHGRRSQYSQPTYVYFEDGACTGWSNYTEQPGQVPAAAGRAGTMRMLTLTVGMALVVVLGLAGGSSAEDGRLAPCPDSPNCVSSQADPDGARYVAPLEFTGPAAEAWAKLRQAALALPRVQVVAETADYLHLTQASQVLGFIDDLEFVLEPEAKRVQVRSAARSGWWDFGVNRKRVEDLRAAWGALEP